MDTTSRPPQLKPKPKPKPSAEAPQPTFRSGAVARMAGMPVSTLRVWEQRYEAVGPGTSASGHRLYSAADVERVLLLRRLTTHGHAIGLLAGLDMAQLRDLSRTHTPDTETSASDPVTRAGAPLRVVVVGQAMAQRLERAALTSPGARAPQVVGVFETLPQAARAAADAADVPIDLLLWHVAGLQADTVPGFVAAQRAWQPRRVAVVYRFAGAAARDAYTMIGASVAREPSDDAVLLAWLSSLAPALAAGGDSRDPATDAWSFDVPGPDAGAAPARRFDDAGLTAFSREPSPITCECPSQLAELLMQIGSFESYSAACASRSPADADLHAYLQRTAGAARILLETALERVAHAEGLALP